MENNGYHLDLFTNSLIQYFNEVLIHKNYLTNSFRKYSLKNGEDTEFSFQIKPPSAKTGGDEKLLNAAFRSANFNQEDFVKLINFSQLWSLHLADVSIRGSRLIFKLNQQQTHYRVIKSILNEEANYGVNFTIPQGVKISINENPVEDLTQLRLRLLKRTSENIIKAVKIQNKDGMKDILEVCLTTKPNNTCKINVLCGVVINSAKRTKETKLSPEDYYNIQLKDMRAMSQHKYWAAENEELLNDLADASVTMSLLEVNPKNTVSLKMESTLNEPRGSISKGATFVLYNCARLASIRRKYHEQCESGVYPQCPNFDELDFSLLKEKEEWYMVFNYLLEYPKMIRKITEDLLCGVLGTHQMCRFLTNLSSLFSVYYRRVQILMEPREHLLPVLHVRLKLLQAVEQVMHNALTLLNIKIIEEM